MTRLRLVRRRQVWVPTLLGWLVLLAVTTTAVTIVGRYMYTILAPNDPAPNSQTLVVEGWIDEEALQQAISIFRAGKYARLVTTGGPIGARLELTGSASFAELAAQYLKAHGLKEAEVIAVPAPASAQDRTFLSAVMVRTWSETHNVRLTAFDLLSTGVHARRSRVLYQIAFGPTVRVGVLSARPEEYDPRYWWRTSAGAKAVIGESIGLIWTGCCFHPGSKGSREEKWGVTRPADR